MGADFPIVSPDPFLETFCVLQKVPRRDSPCAGLAVRAALRSFAGPWVPSPLRALGQLCAPSGAGSVLPTAATSAWPCARPEPGAGSAQAGPGASGAAAHRYRLAVPAHCWTGQGGMSPRGGAFLGGCPGPPGRCPQPGPGVRPSFPWPPSPVPASVRPSRGHPALQQLSLRPHWAPGLPRPSQPGPRFRGAGREHSRLPLVK